MKKTFHGQEVERFAFAGKMSRLNKYDPKEDYKERHQRRYDLSLPGIPAARKWCDVHSVQFKTYWGGGGDLLLEHWCWDFRTPTKFAQWRPYIGRVNMKRKIVGGTYYQVKVYDYLQLLELLEWWIS